MLWVRISIRAMCTTLCDKVCQWLPTGRWFSPGSPVSSTNKTDRHDIAEILLKVTLNTIKQTTNIYIDFCSYKLRFYSDIFVRKFELSEILPGFNEGVQGSLILCKMLIFNLVTERLTDHKDVPLIQKEMPTWSGNNHKTF
jgi:hypothetical protein